MTEVTDPFNFLDNHSGLNEWIAQKQENYEDRCVRNVLTKLNLSNNLKQIYREATNYTGTEFLSFPWFHNTYPTFPVWLCARSLPHVYKISIEDLYKRFTSTVIYKEFTDCKTHIPTDVQSGAWGMIFQWPSVGQMIIHNSGYVPGGTRFIRELGHKQVVYLDILSEFISHISTVWKP